MFFRTTFAAAGEKDVVEAVKRFGEGLRVEFGLNENNGAVNGKVNGHSGEETKGFSNGT